MKNLTLALTLVALACCNPSTPTSDDAVPSIATTTTSAPSATDAFVRIRPSTPPAPQKPDTRSAAEITQAACTAADGSWRCAGALKPPVKLAASSGGTRPTIIQPSWTVPAWFIDESNSIACASDNSTGTSATCVGGCVGATCPSGDGPLLTPDELFARWGTYSPRLRQNTTITGLSSSTGNAHPWYVRPFIENGALVQITCPLTQVTQLVGGLAIVAKARATNQLLNATLGATGADAQFITNVTHPSNAFAWKALGANVFAMTQPLVTFAIPPTSTATEVDTWANGDTVNLQSMPQLNIVSIEPTLADFNGGLNNKLVVSHCGVFDPSGTFVDPLVVNQHVALIEMNSQRTVRMSDITQETNTFYQNVYFRNGLITGGPYNQDGAITALQIQGGAIGDPTAPTLTFAQLNNVKIDKDTILSSNALNPTIVNSGVGGLFIDTGLTLEAAGIIDGTTGIHILYGPGTLNLQGSARWTYPAGGAAGAAAFPLAGGVKENGQTTGCKDTHAAALGACNIAAATGANLDTALGATSGCIGPFGGGQFCNYGP